MDTAQFWQLIDRAHAAAPDDMGAKCEWLGRALRRLDDAELRDFLGHFVAADARAYDWKLWAAAYVLRGGCSDDAFSDFRASLISRGREAFEAALADPDSLAESAPGEELFYEGFQYVALEIAQERWQKIPDGLPPFPARPSGEDWREEDLPRLLPRLCGTADETQGSSEPAVARPASFAAWKKTPLPPEKLAGTFAFVMGRCLRMTPEKHAEMLAGFTRNMAEAEARRSMLQGVRQLAEMVGTAIETYDDALTEQGLPSLTELVARHTRTIEAVLKTKSVRGEEPWDLARRALARRDIVFSAEERAVLTAAVNGFKPKPFAWQELLREDAGDD